MQRTLLNAKTDFSLLWGVRSPHDVVRKAAELGYDAVALADRDGLYGLPAFLAKAKQHNIRPIVAAEVTDPATSQSALLYPLTRTGYTHLCRILSERHCREEFNLERALCEHGGDLAIVTASRRIIARLAGHDHVYFRVGDSLKRPPVKAARPEGRRSAETLHEDPLDPRPQTPNPIRLPAAIVPPAAFFDDEDHELHRLMRAIDLGTRLSALASGQTATPAATFQPPEWVQSRFAALPSAIEGTTRLLDAIRFDADFSEVLFPDFPCPEGMSTIELLRCKTYEGARRRYDARTSVEYARARIPSRTHGRGNPFPRTSQDGNPAACGCEMGISHQSTLPPGVVDRIEYELDLIEEKGFASYFLVVDEIVQRSPRTCGRGSAAASIVAYALGITNVDPIRHNLFFERFLNPGRKDPPDIDVDFAWDERDEVLDWVFDRYGTDRAAMVANHNCFRPRMALRETARVFGLPEGEITAVTRRLPWCWQTDDMEDLANIVSNAPRMSDMDLDPPWPEIIRLATRLLGKPRLLSVHPGGVVLTPGKIWQRVPIQPSAKGVNIVHWEKDGVEDLGLVKIDLLGNRSLAVIRDAIANLRAEGVAFDETQWDPINDPDTQALLVTGRTMGVFYVESPAMRQLQIKTGRGDFEHLVINTSIIRPAANAYTTQYVERVHGVPYEPIHPLLEDILAETYGIMIYQEDVSRVAMAMADFSCEDADRLRKIMSKKDRHLELVHFYRRFVEGARAKGVCDAVIDEVFKMILAFSGYSFCKPHSASYTMVSYESAYLKAHHSAAFMAAVMGNHGGFYSTQAYVGEARRMGIEVTRPDVNLSEQKFIAKQGRIVTGLAEIKGLSRAAQQRVLEQRERNGPYAGLRDLLVRADLTYADAKRLILAGALDRVEPDKNRPTLLWMLKMHLGPSGRARNRSGRRRGGNATQYLELTCTPQAEPSPTPELQPYDPLRTLELEYEHLGFLATAHPLEVFIPPDAIGRGGSRTARTKSRRARTANARHGWIKANQLGEYIGKTVSILSWPISAKTITTGSGEAMEFVSFEDETDIYEAVLFPRQFRRYANLATCDAPIVVTGKVDEDFGAISLIINHIARA